jgi:outer membrane protein TolC
MLNAFREVEDVLASQQITEKRLDYEQRALADRTASVQIATVQYQAGKRDLLWVEQLQTEQLVLQENVIKLRSEQIANRIRLHLALGGSFDAVPSVAVLAGGE